MALASVAFLLLLIGAALLVPPLLPESFLKLNLLLRNLPPSLVSGHLLGTDALGQDVLGRVLLAARVSLGIGVSVVACSALFGAFVGLLSGYFGGFVDNIVMRLVDILMSFPSLLLAVVVLYVAGPGIPEIILVLTLTAWPIYARVARAETLRLKEFAYVEAARAIGCPVWRIIARHIGPNLIATLLTLMTLNLAQVILAESALSFLGLGIQPPAVSWGLMVAQGRGYITQAWWLVVMPGADIFLTTMAFNLLSSGIGRVLDPTAR